MQTGTVHYGSIMFSLWRTLNQSECCISSTRIITSGRHETSLLIMHLIFFTPCLFFSVGLLIDHLRVGCEITASMSLAIPGRSLHLNVGPHTFSFEPRRSWWETVVCTHPAWRPLKWNHLAPTISHKIVSALDLIILRAALPAASASYVHCVTFSE